LNQMTGYADAGGMPPFKFHFYTYTLLIALVLVTFAVGLVRFVSEQAVAQPGVLQFAAVIVLCAAITILRQGMSGVANMANTMFAAPLAVMLAFYLDENRRLKLTSLIIGFVAVNAAIGVCERIAGVNLFVFPEMGGTEYFRSTALMGHPLENAFITSSVAFLVPAMPWSVARKAAVLALMLAGILAFGARSSFAVTLILGAAALLYIAAVALARGKMRVSTLAAAPWFGLLAIGAGAALALGTSLGERIVQLAKIDASAQARIDVFRLFNYLSPGDLLYGVDFAEINFLLKTYKEVAIIENCWIGLLLMLGAILFAVFAVSLLTFLRSIARGRGALAFFAVMAFLVVASTSNSLRTQTASLMIFAVALFGLPAQQKAARSTRVTFDPAIVQGAWS
ncbi:VpsF family polysaccharide biosynthesis protein, partial [Methyloceanibacter sp.]|uniref:VpsF family polysaccharide biosynthesis protein n=1 Tax=Methyloceanibacter sp. TaxID=1965321 RepID=UPI002D6C775E